MIEKTSHASFVIFGDKIHLPSDTEALFCCGVWSEAQSSGQRARLAPPVPPPKTVSEEAAFSVDSQDPDSTQLKRNAGVYRLADQKADDGTKFKRV